MMRVGGEGMGRGAGGTTTRGAKGRAGSELAGGAGGSGAGGSCSSLVVTETWASTGKREDTCRRKLPVPTVRTSCEKGNAARGGKNGPAFGGSPFVAGGVAPFAVVASGAAASFAGGNLGARGCLSRLAI